MPLEVAGMSLLKNPQAFSLHVSRQISAASVKKMKPDANICIMKMSNWHFSILKTF